jgi:hypothetical protein
MLAYKFQGRSQSRHFLKPLGRYNQDVLEQVKYGYMEKPGKNFTSDGSTYYLGPMLFKRINAAHAAKNEKAFDIFLRDLLADVQHHCQILRKGDRAELDAGLTSNRIHRPASSMCTAINNPSSEENIGRSTIPSTPNILPPSVPSREQIPLNTYTTLFKTYALKSAKPPERTCRWDCHSGLWYYEIMLDGGRGAGEAATKKDAEHMASRDICRALNIGSG